MLLNLRKTMKMFAGLTSVFLFYFILFLISSFDIGLTRN